LLYIFEKEAIEENVVKDTCPSLIRRAGIKNYKGRKK